MFFGEGASHSRAQYLQQGPCGPQTLKYLPSVPLQKKLIDTCYRRWVASRILGLWGSIGYAFLFPGKNNFGKRGICRDILRYHSLWSKGADVLILRNYMFNCSEKIRLWAPSKCGDVCAKCLVERTVHLCLTFVILPLWILPWARIPKKTGHKGRACVEVGKLRSFLLTFFPAIHHPSLEFKDMKTGWHAEQARSW